MTTDSTNQFLLHRFITDAIGHFIGAYFSILLTLGIDPHSDRPIAFDHAAALCLAAALILSDFALARLYGNKKWFGLIALLAASTLGPLLLASCYSLFTAITGERPSNLVLDVIATVLLVAVFVLPPALIFPMIIRLMAWPIVRVFQPNDQWPYGTSG